MILELRNELKKAIDVKDLAKAVGVCKEMGISLRYLCRMADVSYGNAYNYLKGDLIYFTDIQKDKLFNTLKQFI